MEVYDKSQTVDPEVRAYISSLVSAVGGQSTLDERYEIGDSAPAVLKDILRWLRLYDDKLDRYDVKRCLADSNLVKGDLLEILALWPEDQQENAWKAKLALECLTLIAALTYPMEVKEETTKVNHVRHMPVLQLAQVGYKRAILHFEGASILRTMVRAGLPAMALERRDRNRRQEGVIRLMLHCFKNLAMITQPQHLPSQGDENEVSRSATINAFHEQDVFSLLLTVGSGVGDEFRDHDVVILETLFHLLKGLDARKLFMEDNQIKHAEVDELQTLMRKEKAMVNSYKKRAPTRHNRFGTMVWVKTGDNRVSTVTGQNTITNASNTLQQMDASKKYNRPKFKGKQGEELNESETFGGRIVLTESARSHLRSFVEDFLDSSFNPLFSSLRKGIESESDRFKSSNHRQFWYLISWFLEAEAARREYKKAQEPSNGTVEDNTFAHIAAVLDQETFVLLNRHMQRAYDEKVWQELRAILTCLTQILLTVQNMSESKDEEDQEIAENIQNRIFYEESTHDRIIAILRGYKDQGFGYLDSCTELSHVFLRMLERYSRENVDLQVRSKRRARKSKRAAAKQRGETNEDEEDQASEMEDMREAERVSRERKFDFTRFSTKFMSQACIDTFVAFAKYYIDLDTEQLKRAHRFFYRVAFKQDLSVMLFRLDIIALFTKMVKGPEGLDLAGPTYKEWHELVRQLIKKLIKKLDQRPELAVELLFSKINSTTFYLEYGYEKQTVSSKPRPPATLVVRGSMIIEEQIGIAVAALYDDKLELIDWVTKTLASAADERQSWEAEALARKTLPQPEVPEDQAEQPTTTSKAPSIVVIPDSDSTRTAMFKDAKLRLLMTLSGFESLGVDDEPGATWVIPSSISSADLRHTHDVVEQHRKNPIFEYGEDDPKTPEEMLRRKPAEEAKRAEYDDDSDGDGIVSDTNMQEEFLFPPGGPTNKPNPHHTALNSLKKKRRKRHTVASDNESGLDDETREERRRAREKADLEKRWKIKSAEFVKDSDDESDEERDRDFFAREEARRRGQGEKVREALMAGRVSRTVEGEKVKPAVKSKKRKSDAAGSTRRRKKRKEVGDVDVDEDVAPWRKSRKESVDLTDDDIDAEMGGTSSRPRRRGPFDDSSESGREDTPLSSPPLDGLSLSKATDDLQIEVPSLQESTAKVSTFAPDPGNDDGEEDDGLVVSTAKRRARTAVFEDSDDD